MRGKNYEVDGADASLPNAPYTTKGVGPFLHFAAGMQPCLLLPVIPEM